MYFSISSYLRRLRSTILGILIISILPAVLFGINTQLSEQVYVYSLKGLNVTRNIFPEIYSQFFYSMTIFFTALLIGLLVSLTLTFITTMLPRFLQRIIYGLLTLFESLPDLFIVVLLQVCIVALYKKTGLLIPFYNDYNNPIYLLPILVLSIVPTIQLFKITLLLMREEQHKPYVTVARAMGLGRFYITLKHVFRNILTSLLQYSKTIFVFMLSNLFIVEYVYNLNGIMSLLMITRGAAFLVTALFIAVPFSILFEIADNYNASVNKQQKEKNAA
ncbi:ABC transporter permease subunit [Fictibacillus phosphorivorans]|uniref:ABC transporter permease subunit n=1 Tax=Fictibacillus phosphorivorans TaxID=1221500 RepID=UPI0012939FBB|nr:ABC transporter permease subunit [Fictibacillus phosphorivorans]MQR93886.1 ABC transporter permease subunit [Fictibacillus phosphorivorans]